MLFLLCALRAATVQLSKVELLHVGNLFKIQNLGFLGD